MPPPVSWLQTPGSHKILYAVSSSFEVSSGSHAHQIWPRPFIYSCPWLLLPTTVRLNSYNTDHKPKNIYYLAWEKVCQPVVHPQTTIIPKIEFLSWFLIPFLFSLKCDGQPRRNLKISFSFLFNLEQRFLIWDSRNFFLRHFVFLCVCVSVCLYVFMLVYVHMLSEASYIQWLRIYFGFRWFCCLNTISNSLAMELQCRLLKHRTLNFLIWKKHKTNTTYLKRVC